MADSARTSTTNFGMETADPEVLEKIESQRVPGEYSPPRSVSDENLDDSSLEKGPAASNEESRAPPSQRPTGFKVRKIFTTSSDE
jgi:hypothetical protein